MRTDEVQLNVNKARQGVVGHGVRYVLAAGLTLAIIAAIVLLVVYWR
jgi:hypothetical protein